MAGGGGQVVPHEPVHDTQAVKSIALASPLAEVHEQVSGLLGCPRARRRAVTPRMCTARVWISITNKTYRRWSSTVSTCRKSQARIPDAWAARNCRQGGGARRGAGPSPAQPGSGGSFPPLPGTRRRATRPECAGNPSAGSTAPSCSTRPRTSAGTGGRPTAFGYVHFLRTRRRCQASKVPEVTIRCSRRPEGSSRESAAITAVSPVRPWTGDLPPQDRDLMPQHQDLCILDGVTSRQ